MFQERESKLGINNCIGFRYSPHPPTKPSYKSEQFGDLEDDENTTPPAVALLIHDGTCENGDVPDRHMKRPNIIPHLHDDEAKARMSQFGFLGGAGGRSARDNEEKLSEGDVVPPTPEDADNG